MTHGCKSNSNLITIALLDCDLFAANTDRIS